MPKRELMNITMNMGKMTYITKVMVMKHMVMKIMVMRTSQSRYLKNPRVLKIQ